MTYTTLPLSASTNGEPIEVTGTDTAGAILVHTAINVAGDYDQVSILANNTSAAAVTVTLEIAGTSQSNLWVRAIPAKTTKLILEDFRLDGGVTIKAFASAPNVVNLGGTVGRTE